MKIEYTDEMIRDLAQKLMYIKPDWVPLEYIQTVKVSRADGKSEVIDPQDLQSCINDIENPVVALYIVYNIPELIKKITQTVKRIFESVDLDDDVESDSSGC